MTLSAPFFRALVVYRYQVYSEERSRQRHLISPWSPYREFETFSQTRAHTQDYREERFSSSGVCAPGIRTHCPVLEAIGSENIVLLFNRPSNTLPRGINVSIYRSEERCITNFMA